MQNTSVCNEIVADKLQKTLEDFQIMRNQFNDQQVENKMLNKEVDLMRRKITQMQSDQTRLLQFDVVLNILF